MNIGRISEKYAKLDPQRMAIIDIPNERRISFGTLDDRIRRLANGLIEDLGLEKGDRVAVLSKNSIEYLEIYFACARSGLIIQPLNWRCGILELVRIINDGKPSVFITSEEFYKDSLELQQKTEVDHWLEYGVDSDGSYEVLIAKASTYEPLQSNSVGDNDPMVILYTGGTSGESKGALHTHKSIFMGMLNQTVAERIVPSDVYMLTGQMFHIPIGLTINYIAHGCPVVLVNFDAKQALEVIQQERVTAFLGITTMINRMLAVENFDSYDLSSLRNIQYGGGPMSMAVVKKALESFPSTLIQGYGQTEGMGMTFLTQEDHLNAVNGIHPERLASCGREGHITSIQVVDKQGIPVPRDGETPGEIIVKSEANMIGYWNRPDLTAETIRDGWMWTGDIATWDQDGYIFIVDRAKDMIISGGENIYSIQVENAIYHHDSVLEVAVFGVPDDEWGEVVKAVVVLKPGRTATEQEIINTAKEHLASYQKPKSVDFVERVPKAPTGKILKRKLRERYVKLRGNNV
ncbi:class I adenylate-forming enzyme family protein [Desertibacillus haloalkaliphilus]|uniref:class I adenylate-forming enzyme family protein n=1 Tax=Desertibacillus haloalkaliphilus TaxID=1328930 RepID=UPI001C25FC52|nr:AMP-binding protein [Desertibacillus haloalkaliphilus]MBU8906246.1 AMP-binding protein [Desertibacillus haloalkaliphilus]